MNHNKALKVINVKVIEFPFKTVYLTLYKLGGSVTESERSKLMYKLKENQMSITKCPLLI